ncbi:MULTISPECIES: TM2 domain-containing protein [unclassified Campylobacter]|uniref:NINE protein n=1 Tax=unclassified Campylobacter TaxID=2593542 RepID=UPI001BDA35DE|nr:MULTISPECIES: TM2 domain-containing protein [unclassified Campylobacter]MBZ7990265.1 NINE protein [Campylobacter sp. RM9331]MBZ7992672.1 NINE protein [Campylobacter sp. RM9333]MBZ8004950.1 NINE protein [Campylobacter sp. RM9332]MBT0879062.1 NINE protein [Campylobacter sp. 2018MI01]MBT0880360.1 NINE protein [Campylobacter sp. 2018MI27]
MDKSSILMLLDNKISSEQKFMLNDKLDNLSEEKYKNLPLIPLKSPILAAVLGFFFGVWGVDRFYQGNMLLGFLKIGLFLIGLASTLIFIGVFILWALYIYVLVDIYFVYKAVQKDNYTKILQIIG